MGQNQATGTYVSAEPVNRYATKQNPAEAFEISINKPIHFDQNKGDFAALQQRILIENFDDFRATEIKYIGESEIPTVDNLTDAGSERLAGLVTDHLKAKGHDAIIFNGNGEHEIVVFDKNNVRKKEGKKQAPKKKQKAKTTSPAQKFLDNREPQNVYEAATIALMQSVLSKESIFSLKDYIRHTGYKSGKRGDLGATKFRLSNRGIPFDKFVEEFYSKYQPENFKNGNYDGIGGVEQVTKAIQDWKGVSDAIERLSKSKQINPYEDNDYAEHMEALEKELRDALENERELINEVVEEELKRNEQNNIAYHQKLENLINFAIELDVAKRDFDSYSSIKELEDFLNDVEASLLRNEIEEEENGK
jgi:hypothetical protein